jgi:hypothetical protein
MKTKVNIYDFIKNPVAYIPDPSDQADFGKVLQSDSITGWFEVVEVTKAVPHETRDCYTGKIFWRTNWEEVSSSIEALKLPYLSHLQFYFEHREEGV